MENQELDTLVEKAADLILTSRRLVVFTGAGISTESGIPDFRSPGGIWDRFDPDDFTIDRFLNSEEARRKQWYIFREGLLSDKAEPNPAHHAVAELYRQGRLDCVITQNIDNLHQKAGVPDDLVFELHGNMQWAICLQCGRRYPLVEVKARIDGGEEIPDCQACSSRISSCSGSVCRSVCWKKPVAVPWPPTCASSSAPRWWSTRRPTCPCMRSKRAHS